MTQIAQADTGLSQMDFQKMQILLNDTFSLQQGSSTREITLVEVKQILEKKPEQHSWQKTPPIKDEPAKENGERLPFTLVFRFPKDHEVEQGIYHISHSDAGVFEGTFFTPFAEDEDGIYFEAIFT